MIPDAVVTDADVRTAQNVLDAWMGEGRLPVVWPRQAGKTKTLQDLLELRGLLAAAFADVRAAGHLEGMQAGRRELARMVQDLLEDEGLTP